MGFLVVTTIIVAYVDTHGGLLAPKVQVAAKAPVAAIVSNDSTAEATISEDDKPISPREAGLIFSTYIGELQAKLFVMQFMADTYRGRIAQDAAFRNLDDMRADSETLKTSLMSTSEEVGNIPFGMLVEEADEDYWENVQNAAEMMAADAVEMAVDVAVQANYGADDGGADMNRLSRDIRQQRKAFEAAIMAGYKHFGYKPSEVDMKTLTLKASAPSEQPESESVVTTAEKQH
jgi:hypothetical protein